MPEGRGCAKAGRARTAGTLSPISGDRKGSRKMARRFNDRPLAPSGWRPAGLRADPGQRLQARWSCPGPRCRSSSATCITRSARSTSRRARRAWPTSSSTCCSRGPSGSPRGRSTGWRSSRRGSPTPRPARTAPTTGSLPVRPLGAGPADRGRPDERGAVRRPTRSRPSGTSSARSAPASSTRPRAGSTRPTWPSPTSATPIATRSWAGPRTWRGSASRTCATSTRPTTAPTGRSWSSSATSTRAAALDRVEAHFGAILPGDRPDAPRRPVDRAARRRAGATSCWSSSESLTARAAGLAHRATRPSRRPGFDVLADLLTCGPAVAALAGPGRAGSKLATWVEAAQAAARRAGQFFIQVECAARARSGATWSGRIAEISAELADDGPDSRGTGPVAEPARGGLAVGAGRPGGPGRRARPCRPLGRLARLAGRACRRAGRRRRRHPPRRLGT